MAICVVSERLSLLFLLKLAGATLFCPSLFRKALVRRVEYLSRDLKFDTASSSSESFLDHLHQLLAFCVMPFILGSSGASYHYHFPTP
jgi:hypothetical protein